MKESLCSSSIRHIPKNSSNDKKTIITSLVLTDLFTHGRNPYIILLYPLFVKEIDIYTSLVVQQVTRLR